MRKLYTEQLVRRGDFDLATAEKDASSTFERSCSRRSRRRSVVHRTLHRRSLERPNLEDVSRGDEDAAVGVPRERLLQVLEGLERTPPGFSVHPKLARQLAQRKERFETGPHRLGRSPSRCVSARWSSRAPRSA